LTNRTFFLFRKINPKKVSGFSKERPSPEIAEKVIVEGNYFIFTREALIQSVLLLTKTGGKSLKRNTNIGIHLGLLQEKTLLL
jgi:hypothetical protein